jgi:predicted Ser/Thr protein kinase
MAVVPLRQGDPTRIGRFRLTARLGAGGMGVVYLGEAKGAGRVAVKVIRPEAGDEEEFRARFAREVALLRRIDGLCTVRVVEADTESPDPFLVTEYAEGPSLSEHVKRNGPLDPEMLVGLATGLAEALVAIHAAGVVHRDLKPGNVILTRLGPKVIDFGIAQALDGTVMTRTGMSLGSPGFMAPEQITGAPGQAADVFAWGLTVAYAASGKQPFGSGPAEVLPYRIVHESPDITEVPDFLRPLVEAAVSKDPAQRPTAGDLLAWLTAGAVLPVPEAEPEDEAPMPPTQRILAQTWQPPPESDPAAAMPAAAPAKRATSWRGLWGARDARPSSPLRTRAALVGAVVLALVAGAGVTYAIDSGNSKAATGAQSGPAVADGPTPTVTFGAYTGRRPFAIVLNNALGGGTIQDIRWNSWTAAGASGTGELGNVTAKVELSAPADGRFTRIGETTEGALTIQLSSAGDWPSGATAALPPTCAKPTSAQLIAAFDASPTTVKDGWAAAGADIFEFDGISCWKVWVVASAGGSGEGTMVFSIVGGLHLMPASDMESFSGAVCADPDSPPSWKGPDTGLATC